MPSNERSNTGAPAISALTETEAPHGWAFEMSIPSDDAPPRTLTMVLSWVDYEYWSHGASSPSRVAETVLRALLEIDPKRDLPARFDASTARRWARDIDHRIRELM